MQNISSVAPEAFDWGGTYAGSWTFTTSCGAIFHRVWYVSLCRII